MKKNNVSFTPHPDRVLVKITKEAWESLFYKEVIRDDGNKVKLFTVLEESEGFDNRYAQNVSCGTVVAVGRNITDMYPSDTVMLDYLASNNVDILVGYVNGDRLISVVAKTTYHTEDAKPYIDGRKAYVKGDYEEVSPLIGVIRHNKLLSFAPYCFLVHKSNKIISVLPNGRLKEDTEKISCREVLSACSTSGFKDGDMILVKETDLFSRVFGEREVSVVFQEDILCKK